MTGSGRKIGVPLRSTQGRGEHGEGHQQQVAGEHVGEEPDRQAEGPHEELETNSMGVDQDVERLRHARRDRACLR